MGTSSLKLGGVDYVFHPLSLSEFDETGRAIVARPQFSICEEFFGVSVEYLLIPGAIEPAIDTAHQDYWPALVERFKQINPFSVVLTQKMKEIMIQQIKEDLAKATMEKELDSESG